MLIDRFSSFDEQLVRGLGSFVPAEVFDIHVHLVIPSANLPEEIENATLGLDEFSRAVGRWMPDKKLGTLVFGFPSTDNDRNKINSWIAEEVRRGSNRCVVRGLVLTSPSDDPIKVDELLSGGEFVGIKPYHCYAPQTNTRQARIEEFAPEWMWELCAAHNGILMLHIVRDRGINDEANISTIHLLARKYPRCQLILAHVARSFNYRSARSGLRTLVDLGNVWVDTSAITEMETFRKAIEILGPQRILYGSDYPCSESRGRCVTTGDFFNWIFAYKMASVLTSPERMTLIGIESLLCLREAAEDCGLGDSDLRAIFHDNGLRLLQPHLGKKL